jgi:hypothetical protein
MRAVRALLTGLVDYAGLFPPAALPMAKAVVRYQRALTGPHAWMLGHFVVPVERLDAFAAAAENFLPPAGDAASWRLSVLASGDAQRELDAIRSFNDQHGMDSGGCRATVNTVERKVGGAADLAAASVFRDAGLDVFCELLPGPDLGELSRAVRDLGAAAKVRAGGVTADAIPSTSVLAAWIGACAATGVRFKATAGLHHAVRGAHRLTYERESAKGVMHGFLNVLLAAATAWDRRESAADDSDERECVRLLLERTDRAAVHAADDRIAWGDRSFSTDLLARTRRAFCTAIGSCSFDEPVQELQTLGFVQ